jgi:hypothetical protein
MAITRTASLAGTGAVTVPINTAVPAMQAIGLADPETGNVATLAVFHASDNQNPGGTVVGLLTGGVAQLLNASGNLDRQTETASDVVSNKGIATGTQQLAWPVTCGPVTSGAIVGSATAQTITLTAVSGSVRGVAWALQVGQALVLDANTSTQEAFVIAALNVGAKTVTGVIRNSHASTAPAITFFYDQGRSAMIADGATGQGIQAGGTLLYNGTLNGGNGGWELARSAAGENDGSPATGAATAIEYHFNSGGPTTASGALTGLAYDRARNLVGKGSSTATITSTGVGNTTITFPSAAATATVYPGAPITLTGGAVTETVYSTAAWVPGSAAAIPLQSPVVNATQTSARWDVYAAAGPGTSGMGPGGIGVEEDVVFDTLTNLYYGEVASSTDGLLGRNIVAMGPTLFDGAAMNRQRGNVDWPTPLISATGVTVNQGSGDLINYNSRGVKVALNMTVVGTGSVTLSIQGKDLTSGAYYTILTGAAVTVNGLTVYTLYPGVTTAANAAVSDILPRTWRVVVTAGNANPTTYTVGASLIL